MDGDNEWEPVALAVLEEIDDVVDRRLRAFRDALENWLNDLLAGTIPDDWGDQLAHFVASAAEQGLAVSPDSVDAIARIIESRAGADAEPASQPPPRRVRSRMVDGAFVQSVIPNAGEPGGDSKEGEAESTGTSTQVVQTTERFEKELRHLENDARRAKEPMAPLAKWGKDREVPRYADLMPWMRRWIDKADLSLPRPFDEDFVLLHPEYLSSVQTEIRRLTSHGESLGHIAALSSSRRGDADAKWRDQEVNALLRYLETNRYQWIKTRERIYDTKIRAARFARHLMRSIEQPENLEMAGALIGLSGAVDASPTPIPLRPRQLTRSAVRPPIALPKSTSVPKEAIGEYTTTIKWAVHDIAARPSGPGYWGVRIRQSNTRVDAFELKINPNNESFYLPRPGADTCNSRTWWAGPWRMASSS